MKPASDPTVDYKAVVRQGYDLCAAPYAEARSEEVNPELALLTNRLHEGAAVLDIGCGCGVPIARTLARQCHVTGVDISDEQIRRAQRNVPEGSFIHGDIMAMEFPLSRFDAAVAYYALFHLPREEHPELLRRIHRWLRPGGYLLMAVTRFAEAPYTEDDFFGVTMYWSNYGLDDYQKMLTEIGFKLLETTVIGHGYAEDKPAPAEQHPLIFAQAEK